MDKINRTENKIYTLSQEMEKLNKHVKYLSIYLSSAIFKRNLLDPKWNVPNILLILHDRRAIFLPRGIKLDCIIMLAPYMSDGILDGVANW